MIRDVLVGVEQCAVRARAGNYLLFLGGEPRGGGSGKTSYRKWQLHFGRRYSPVVGGVFFISRGRGREIEWWGERSIHSFPSSVEYFTLKLKLKV